MADPPFTFHPNGDKLHQNADRTLTLLPIVDTTAAVIDDAVASDAPTANIVTRSAAKIAELLGQASGAVSSVAGKTGDVNVAIADIAGLQTALDGSSAAATSAVATITTASALLVSTAASALSAQTLFVGETDGFAIEAGAAATQVYVNDGSDKTKAFSGRLEDWLPATVFPAEKLCLQADGSLQWSDHNLITFSNDLTNAAWSKVAATIGAPDGAGFQTITSTGTNCDVWRSRTEVANRAYGWQFITRAQGAGDWLAFQADASANKVWMNMTTGQFGTVGTGYTAQVFTTNVDGTPLPAGDFRWFIWFVSTGSGEADFYLPTGDATLTSAAGKVAKIKNFQAFRGTKPLRYLATTSAARYAAPIDWTNGAAEILIEPSQVARSLWADDLTNAAWAATNVTTAATSTGPHGAACSLLTASSANGTVLQAVTLAAASRAFAPFVRRKTGTGAIFMTVDGGTNWTDITASLNVNTYQRIPLASSAANPSIGFKIATSGDAIEVSLANIVDGVAPTSPIPTYAATGVGRTADAFTLPSALYTFAGGNPAHVYAQVSLATSYATFSPSLQLGNTAGTQYVMLSHNIAAGTWIMTSTDGTTTKANPIGTIVNGERGVELTMRPKTNEHVCSMNGDLPMAEQSPGAVTQDKLVVGPGSGPIWLRRLVVSKRGDIANADLYKWRWSRKSGDPGMVGSTLVALDSEAAGVTMQRAPSHLVLSETGNRAKVLSTWSEKHSTGFHPEAPARTKQRLYDVVRNNDGSLTFLPLTAALVLLEQAGWASGTGHVQPGTPFRVDRMVAGGAPKGRIILPVTMLPSASTDFNNPRDFYFLFNDYDGDATKWSAPVKITSMASGDYAIVTGNGGVRVLPSDHPTTPNRVVVMIYTSTGVRSVYSDTFGGPNCTDWTLGALLTIPGETISETTLDTWGDGTLVATHRLDSGTTYDRRMWSKSSDGATFTSQGLVPSWKGANCDASTCNLARKPSDAGRYGRVAMARPVVSGTSGRYGCRLDFASDETMTLGSAWYALDPARYFGYSTVSLIFGDTLLLSAEGSNETAGFNVRNNVYMAGVRPPWAGFGGLSQAKRLPTP